MKPSLAWTLAVGGGGVGGAALLLLVAALGPATTSVIHVEGACPSGSIGMADEPDAPGATRFDLHVSDGETFAVPVPEGAARGARYQVVALGSVTLGRAPAEGADAPLPPGRWAGALGGCRTWDGQPPEELVRLVARGEGTVRVTAWATA